MADYRCIYRNAGTGQRASALTHLGFRVWMQYQLSADDFGVCPATATKLMGDNEALNAEPVRRVQSEINKLVTIGLCGEFHDGPRRYLYQPDWQDWQRLKYAASSANPAPSSEILEKCSPKTQILFREHHPKFKATSEHRAYACDANANGKAPAVAVAEGVPGDVTPAADMAAEGRDTVARRAAVLGIVRPGDWERHHAAHALRGEFCGWVCLPTAKYDEFCNRTVGAGFTPTAAAEYVDAWARAVKQDWTSRAKIPADNIFKFWSDAWAKTHGAIGAPRRGGGLDRMVR